MVVEELTFEVAPAELEDWLVREGDAWDRRLAAHPGFLRKEVWQPDDGSGRVHVLVWWASVEEWKAVPRGVLQSGDDQMGELLREPSVRSLRVLRRITL